jgi:hypothetical protein
MSETATAGFQRITSTEVAPAVWHPGWLPKSSPFPELSEAREEYDRLRAVRDAAVARRRDLEAQIEAERGQRSASLRDAYLDGEASPQAEEVDQELAQELETAKQHTQAALDALLAHINNTIVLVAEHRQQWLGEIDGMEQDVASEITATEARLRELRANVGTHGRLQHWIARTAEAASFPVQHFPYAEIAATSGDEAQDLEREMHKSYAGAQKLISNEEADALRARSDARGELEPTEPTAEVTATQLDDGELVDWIMGAGMFDGHPRPSAAQVLAAAEGDPALASRLVKAEQNANPEAPRADLIDALTQITNRKAQG